MLKLSIITINLNNGVGLKKTIESVVKQSFSNFEFIIIDGASTDESVNIITQYASNIHFWKSEQDSGIYNAMNKGILHAQGEYCLFLNSGDYLYNEHVLEVLFNHNFIEDIVYGNQYVEKDGVLEKSLFLTPEYITFKSFMNATIPHQCAFIKRELFNVIGLYNENNKIVSDWEWNALALFKYNCSLRKIEIPVTIYDTTGISSNKLIMQEHTIEKRLSLISNFPRIVKDMDDYEKSNLLINKIPRIFKRILKRL